MANDTPKDIVQARDIPAVRWIPATHQCTLCNMTLPRGPLLWAWRAHYDAHHATKAPEVGEALPALYKRTVRHLRLVE